MEPEAIPGPNNKVIYLVRHAQAFHNLKFKNHSIPDPLLTPKGLTQCADLSTSFPVVDSAAIELLVTSPLRRALYTTIHSFPSVLERGIPIISLPEAQETGAGLKPCDTGSNREILEHEFKDFNVDLTLVYDGWNPSLDAADTAERLRERAASVRRWLRVRPERVICLVSHGGFLHYLSEDWEGFVEKKGTAWANCEWRSYTFKEGIGAGDVDARLVEIKSSRARRDDG